MHRSGVSRRSRVAIWVLRLARVAIMLPNLPQYPVAVADVLEAGAAGIPDVRKRPLKVFLRDSLPESPIGKVLRRKLSGAAGRTQTGATAR